jgi:ABC-2 type transport system ATP-binding protein
MPENSIEVAGLTKRFGSFTAVDGLTFSVAKGEVFGFLGANGAGKSTTIRMLCALLTPTSGTARVAGYDITTEPERVKENIGYMSQKFSLYEDLTVEENIHFYGGVYGLTRRGLKSRMPWALEMAGLAGKEHLLTRNLAGGWKQRLALGCALLHGPKVVFLDEPTGGVDPVSRRRFWDLINSLAESGVTVFVTTHYLDEAEYCSRIMLMHAGAIVAGGSPQELKIRYLVHPILEVECEGAVEAMDALQRQAWVLGISLFGNRIHVTVGDEKSGREQTAAVLVAQGLMVKRIDRILPTLEDVFIHLIEEKQRTSPGLLSSNPSEGERGGEA